MSTTYDLDCGKEVITLELLDDGTLITYGFDLESELIAKEMGFEPHPCFAAMGAALWDAVENLDIDIAELLLAAGADVHANNDYSLRWAAHRGHENVVKLLLEYGADVHTWYNAALRDAVAKGHADVVKLLLEYGADIHADNDGALRLAAGNGQTAIVRLLLEHGADVHAREDAALWLAAKGSHADVVEILENWIKEHG